MLANEQLTRKCEKSATKTFRQIRLAGEASKFCLIGCLPGSFGIGRYLRAWRQSATVTYSGRKLLSGGKFLRRLGLPALLLSSSALVLASQSATLRSAALETSNHGVSGVGVEGEEASRKDYVGGASCQACHQGIEGTYEHTAHHLTSQLPSKTSIAGKFTAGSNTLRTLDPNLHFVMTAVNGGYFETAVFGQPPDELKQTERIDLVVGSGERGQTFLYWKGDRLFQLPVSFWTPLEEWANSPGYRDGTADFDRPVVPRCLECHATYFSAIPSEAPANRYHRAGSVLGISCERCHGPGRQHVEFEKSGTQYAPKAGS